MKMRRLVRVLVFGLVFCAVAFAVTCTRVDRIDLASSSFYAESVANLDRALDAGAAREPAGLLEAGAARVEIVPPGDWDVPMGGNRHWRVRRAAGTAPESVHVRSIAIRQGSRKVVMSCIDILVITPTLNRLVLERIRQRLPLENHEFLPIATHTHNGPGGYWEGWLPQQVLGTYQERLLEHLVERIALSAVQAWESLKPARVLVDSVRAGLVANEIRLLEPRNRYLGVVRFEGIDEDFTIDLLNFAAQPAAGLDESLLSGDYPGILIHEVETEHHLVAFTPGTVGDQRPRRSFDFPGRRVDTMARLLKERGWDKLQPEPVDPPPLLETYEFEVRMPPLQARGVALDWRFRDWIAGALLPDLGTTRIQVVRLGPVLLLGAPCDMAYSTAIPILEKADERGFFPLIVSMAEDWVGYVLTEEEYERDDYKVRGQMHGAVSGPLFRELYLRIIDRLADRKAV